MLLIPLLHKGRSGESWEKNNELLRSVAFGYSLLCVFTVHIAFYLFQRENLCTRWPNWEHIVVTSTAGHHLVFFVHVLLEDTAKEIKSNLNHVKSWGWRKQIGTCSFFYIFIYGKKTQPAKSSFATFYFSQKAYRIAGVCVLANVSGVKQSCTFLSHKEEIDLANAFLLRANGKQKTLASALVFFLFILLCFHLLVLWLLTA